MSDLEAKIQSLIDYNVKMQKSVEQLRNAHHNASVIAQCDAQYRLFERNIQYLESELNKARQRKEIPQGSNLLASESQEHTNGASLTSKVSVMEMLKSDSPCTHRKVALKLHELVYRLEVEKRVLTGTKNLIQAVSNGTGNYRKSLNEARKTMDESLEKIAIFNTALRKYKDISIADDSDDPSGAMQNIRGQVHVGHRQRIAGELHIQILGARDLSHPAWNVMKNHNTSICIRIDGVTAFWTKPSRTGHWAEHCTIPISKPSLVEISLYDRDGDQSKLVGLLWFHTTEIAEDKRRRKLRAKASMSMDTIEKASNSGVQKDLKADNGQGRSVSPLTKDEGIQGWFDVEPLGQLLLHIDFVRKTSNPRTESSKLGRADAVRKRKEKVYKVNGHRFVEKHFYQFMKCAICGDFLVNTGFQCRNCNYTCHKRCSKKGCIKCITLPELPHEDTERIHHKIPHRFVHITTIGANWCCHCGYLLPLNQQSAQRCSECNVTCHTQCMHFVPDFCGLPTKLANQMMTEVEAARKRLPQGSGGSSEQSLMSSNDSPSPASATTFTFAQLSLEEEKMEQDRGETPDTNYSSDSARRFEPIPNPAWEGRSNSMRRRAASTPAPPKLIHSISSKQSLDDFTLLTLLGKGSFGKVFLAEMKSTKKVFALKILSKKFILDNDELESVRSERSVFQTVNRDKNPFLVNLHSCFQTSSHVVFVMEYIPGGDLMWHIQREPFSEQRARFYASEVLLGLQFLHHHGVIYRDLKLDNIVLDLDGHIKISDYGLSKVEMRPDSTTTTFCGTPEFMAPEILLEQPYDNAVDWWAFGVLVYEMLFGHSPFGGESEEEIFDAILEDEVMYAPRVSTTAIDLCQKLLVRDPTKRLGYGIYGAEIIKNHPFFDGIQWDEIHSKQMQPPFLPSVKNRYDTSNFDEEFTQEPVDIGSENTFLSEKEQERFAGFSYVGNVSE